MVERPTLTGRIKDQVCEAIAASATEDKKWVTLRRIQKYFEDYSEIEPRKVERNLLTVLRDLEKQETVIRKDKSFTFRAMETIEDVRKAKRAKDKKKLPMPPKEKKLGPDVVVTSSGRVSILRR
jgi:biopolymer transport protein ExbD